MDNQKSYKIWSLIGGAIFILGVVLCCKRFLDITSNKIVSAKILSVEEFNGECRRVSGKAGNCLLANLEVEFPINRAQELRKGKITVERANPSIAVGSEIKVMFLPRKPETVKVADISSGWKGPLGVFFIGSLILFVSGVRRG